MQIARAPRSPLTKLLPLLVLFLVIAGAISVVLLQQSLKNSQDTRNQAYEGFLPGESSVPFPRDGEERQGRTDVEVGSGCARAGCGGEICTDTVRAREIVTQCFMRQEYTCAVHSSCRIQDNGQCGWTQTAEYQACLAGINDPASPSPSASPEETVEPTPTVSPSPSPSPSPTYSRSDFNQDGVVDLLDYTVLVSEFFQVRETYQADLNGDEKVDLLDYSLFVQDIDL